MAVRLRTVTRTAPERCGTGREQVGHARWQFSRRPFPSVANRLAPNSSLALVRVPTRQVLQFSDLMKAKESSASYRIPAACPALI
jgi:hypothetical protein